MILHHVAISTTKCFNFMENRKKGWSIEIEWCVCELWVHPIVALAEKYLAIPCSCMSPNSSRLELLENMIDDFRGDAVIDLTWQACHTYNIEAFEVGKLLKSKGLPYLHLEVTIPIQIRKVSKSVSKLCWRWWKNDCNRYWYRFSGY